MTGFKVSVGSMEVRWVRVHGLQVKGMRCKSCPRFMGFGLRVLSPTLIHPKPLGIQSPSMLSGSQITQGADINNCQHYLQVP